MTWNNNNVVGFVAIVATLLVAETGAQVCSSYGFFCESCTTVSICQSSIPTGVALSCPDGYYCDSTSSNVCTAGNCTSEPYAFYECESTGRYAWTYNCSEYIWCVNNSGIITPTLQDCPSTTVFNPNTATCVLATSYDCVDATTATSADDTTSTTDDATTATDDTTSSSDATTSIADETTSTTDETTSTTDETTSTTDEPTTTTDDTASTTDETASTTDAAASTTDDTTSTTDETTSTTDQTTSTTDQTTSTTGATTSTTAATTTTSTTAATTTTSTTEAPFTCTAAGRFAITTDKTCQSYHFCYLETNGEWLQMLLTCPTTTVFNPTSSTCVAPSSYTCTN